MITGRVNADLEAVIRLRVSGSNGQEAEIGAVIDTGFNGFLTLPPALIARLGCSPIGRGRAILADGREELFDIYETNVLWDGQTRAVEADAADTDALVGMSLLYGFDLRVRTINGGSVTIEAIPTTA